MGYKGSQGAILKVSGTAILKKKNLFDKMSCCSAIWGWSSNLGLVTLIECQNSKSSHTTYKMAAVILLGLVSNETGCWRLSWAQTHGVPIPSREGCKGITPAMFCYLQEIFTHFPMLIVLAHRSVLRITSLSPWWQRKSLFVYFPHFPYLTT